MIDISRLDAPFTKDRRIANNALAMPAEGQLLMWSAGADGEIEVVIHTGEAATITAGFAICDYNRGTSEVVVEDITIPAVAPFTATIAHLPVAASEYVYDQTAAGAMAQTAAVGPPPTPADNEYDLVDATGVMTFNVADKEHVVRIYYRYLVTVVEFNQLYGQRSVNNNAQEEWAQVTVAENFGEIFTSFYDTHVAYASGAPLYPQDGGVGCLSSAAGAHGLPPVGVCSHVPTPERPYLGCKFNIAHFV